MGEYSTFSAQISEATRTGNMAIVQQLQQRLDAINFRLGQIEAELAQLNATSPSGGSNPSGGGSNPSGGTTPGGGPGHDWWIPGEYGGRENRESLERRRQNLADQNNKIVDELIGFTGTQARKNYLEEELARIKAEIDRIDEQLKYM